MEERTVAVEMAEMKVARSGESLKTVLGSCVGVILRDARTGLSGLAHVMLPERFREDDTLGKYADTAVPALVNLLEKAGCRAPSLEALVVGGGQMFPVPEGRVPIGTQNVAAVRAALARVGIPIVYEEVGGTAGRSVTYSNASGTASVRTLHSFVTRG